MTDSYHRPVMLAEALDGLALRPDGTYVDVTFGGGGHSRAILKRLGAEGRLFAFDQDEDAARRVESGERRMDLWITPKAGALRSSGRISAT